MKKKKAQVESLPDGESAGDQVDLSQNKNTTSSLKKEGTKESGEIRMRKTAVTKCYEAQRKEFAMPPGYNLKNDSRMSNVHETLSVWKDRIESNNKDGVLGTDEY
jgi:hypothetical protein